MERQNPGMVRFMDRLNEKMEVLDEKIQNKAAKAGEDYLSFFESRKKCWSIGKRGRMSAWIRCSGRTSQPAVPARWRTWRTRCGSNASSSSWRITVISSGCLPTRSGSRRRGGIPGDCGKRKAGEGQSYRHLPLPGDHEDENKVKLLVI